MFQPKTPKQTKPATVLMLSQAPSPVSLPELGQREMHPSPPSPISTTCHPLSYYNQDGRPLSGMMDTQVIESLELPHLVKKVTNQTLQNMSLVEREQGLPRPPRDASEKCLWLPNIAYKALQDLAPARPSLLPTISSMLQSHKRSHRSHLSGELLFILQDPTQVPLLSSQEGFHIPPNLVSWPYPGFPHHWVASSIY